LQRRSPAAACGRSPRTWENFHCGSWEGRGSGRPEDEEEEVGDGDGAMELEFVPRRRLPAAPLIVAAYRIIMYRKEMDLWRGRCLHGLDHCGALVSEHP